jgi:signal transduction histidine kinase/ActR/RegA family two-component response regulator
MDTGKIPPEVILGRRGQAMKPKPASLQHSFTLVQAGSVAVTLLLVATALFVGEEVRSHLASTFEHLEATLSVQSRVHEALAQTEFSFWAAYPKGDQKALWRYQKDSRDLRELTGRYAGIPLTDTEQRQVEKLGEREGRLLDYMDRILMKGRESESEGAEFRHLEELTREIEVSLRLLTDLQADQVRTATRRLDTYTRGLFITLMVCPLFAIGALEWLRYMQRRHLWKPLEQFRLMLQEVKRGNLNVHGEIPPNLEFGAVVSAFLEMSAELRDMRNALEQRVSERTARLDAAQKELLQSAKLASLGQLVSGVAHEINNPLTSILGFSEVLLSGSDLSARVRPQIETIREEAMRLKKLIINLSSFARQAPHSAQRIDLCLVLDQLAVSRRGALDAKPIQLHTNMPREAVWVLGDPDQLQQVFLSLVLNAEQAIEAGHRERGEIWLRCGVDDEGAWVTVTDNGIGMANDVREHIFDPFYTTGLADQRTGLGLSISHGIVQQHRGQIIVESVPGKGTTVRVSLPLAPKELKAIPEAIAPPPSAAAGSGESECRVLVIDDETAIGEFLEMSLTKRGCRVTLLSDPMSLEAALEKATFDLVICDLKMPRRNGAEVLRLLRQTHAELAKHFLLMTGSLADVDANFADLPSIPVLAKPFTSSQLMDAVRAARNRQSVAVA